jgi:hypothetical protein
MILIPFFWNTSNPNWSKFGIFLCEGGRSLWSVDDKATLASTKKMLKENGFPVLNLNKIDNVLYAEIDHKTMNIDDFYLWNDIPLGSEQDVWRIMQIPTALWSCPIFKEHFCKSSNLPECALKPLLSMNK